MAAMPGVEESKYNNALRKCGINDPMSAPGVWDVMYWNSLDDGLAGGSVEAESPPTT